MTNFIAFGIAGIALFLLLGNISDPNGSLVAKFTKRFLGKNGDESS